MIRIVDVNDVQHAGRVVGQIDVGAVLGLLVDEGGVDATGHPLGELADHLGMGRILQRSDDDPVLAVGRALPGVDQVLAVRRGHDVVHPPGIRHQRVGHDRVGGIGDVDGVHPVAAATSAEVEVLAVGVNPDLFGAEQGAGEPAHDGGGAANIAISEGDGPIHTVVAEGRGHQIRARLVADEGSIIADERPHPGRNSSVG